MCAVCCHCDRFGGKRKWSALVLPADSGVGRLDRESSRALKDGALCGRGTRFRRGSHSETPRSQGEHAAVFFALQKSRRGRGSPRRASRARTEDLFFNDNGEALL